MKKICSTLLALCLVLSLMTAFAVAPSAAFEKATIGENDTTATVDGVEYKVLRTADDFLAIDGTTGNYIFANDIDLNLKKEGDNAYILNGFNGILNGNGYALKGYSLIKANNSGLINGNATEGWTITFLNLSLGTEESPILIAEGGNGSAGAIVGKLNTGCKFYFKNCHAYVNHTGSEKALKGGYIGCIQNPGTGCEVTFEDCTSNGKIVGNNKNGGFIAALVNTDAPVKFINCANNTEMSCAKQGVGGFIGDVADKSSPVANVSFENCVNNAKLVASGDSGVGGLIGYIRYNANVRIKNCSNMGILTSGEPTKVGTLIGDPVGDGGVASITMVLNDGESVIAGMIGNAAKQTAENTVITTISFSEKEIASAADLVAITESGSYTLTADITLETPLGINVTGKEITLNLGGKTLTGMLVVAGEGSFTLNGAGSLVGVDAENPALYIGEKATAAVKGATVGNVAIMNSTVEITESTVNGFVALAGATKLNINATVNAGAAPAISLASKAEAEVDNTCEVTVSGGTYTSTGAATVAWTENTKLTVNGGTFVAENGTAISVSNGTVVIAGGKTQAKTGLALEAGDNAMDVKVVGGEIAGTEAAVNVLNAKETCVLAIGGGTFKGAMKTAEGTAAKITATAGACDTDITGTAFLSKEYVSVLNSETSLYEIKLHEHDYEGVDFEYMNVGSHAKSCKICGEKQSEAHSWSEPKDNGDGTHSKYCEVCDSKSNPQEHKETCKNNGNGTHKTTCSECDLNATADHTFENGVCVDCKAKESAGTSANNGGDNGGDSSGGCGASVSALCVVLALSMAAPMIVRKKHD